MESEDNVGLSDIIDVLFPPIPEQNDVLTMGMPSPQHAETYAPPQQSPSRIPQDLASPSTSSASGAISKKPKPYIKIIEQPAPKALRFRYKCEGRSAGSIPGINSTPENKTYPSIEIVGYKGEVVIVVSCVTTKAPYRPHPHNIVGKDEKSCNNGICTLTINGDPLQAVFSNLGIQCVKKKDIKAALDIRENLKVDPFKTKFSHKDQPSSIDLNAVRLCFQAFQRTPDGPKILAKPVVTEPIYDKKGIYELTICRLCSCSAKVGGGDEIILLCEKFAKDDIKIRFFELSAEGKLIWEAFAEFQQTDIHKQNAIAFKTPRYHNVEITEKAKVFIQLVRPSDQETSEPLPFEYYPDTDHFKRKRLKTAGNPMAILKRELLKQENQQSSQASNDFRDASSTFTGANSWNPFPMGVLETEATSSHLTSYRNTLPVASPSPQPPSPCNRLDTPSPGLTKALSAESQQKMCDVFEFGAAMQDPQRQAAGQEQIQQQQQQQQQYPNTNPFRRNSDNNFNQSLPRQQLNGINDQLINHQLLAPRISGGSITPIWNTETIIVRNNTPELHQMNIVTTIQQQQMPQQQQQQQIPQQQQQMRQHLQQMTHQQMQHQQQQLEMQQVQMQIQQQQVQLQQQQQEQQQYQQQFTQIHQQHQMQMHDIETILNAATTEECPTLSGLMQYVDSDQLMNLNTEDLPISNLSIST